MSSFDPRSQSLLANALMGTPSPRGGGLLAALDESIRRRSSWNDRFEHWEKPESDTEYDQIVRARNMVHAALQGNAWLMRENVRMVQQGSFTNRTNTRGESDIDLRVQHPLLRVDHAAGVSPHIASIVGGYVDSTRTFYEVDMNLQAEIAACLRLKFGKGAVDDSGSKAIRVNGVDGSRAEVDVVPCFTLHHITSSDLRGNNGFEGAAILGTDGLWTYNYPDQHIANNLAKWNNTSRRFRRVVRTIKRMQADMIEHGQLDDRVPSFLVECLVHLVEDVYFLQEVDDRYDRVKRVLGRALEYLDSNTVLFEINGVKPLFGAGQSWTRATARSFVSKALAHLGDA